METAFPQDKTVKYLGIHLDRRLTWKTHIFTKRKQLGLIFQRLYWILGRKSEDHHQTHTDVRHNFVGHSLPLQHRNPAKISEQSSQGASKRPLVHTQQPTIHRSTNVNSSGRNNEPQQNLQSETGNTSK